MVLTILFHHQSIKQGLTSHQTHINTADTFVPECKNMHRYFYNQSMSMFKWYKSFHSQLLMNFTANSRPITELPCPSLLLPSSAAVDQLFSLGGPTRFHSLQQSKNVSSCETTGVAVQSSAQKCIWDILTFKYASGTSIQMMFGELKNGLVMQTHDLQSMAQVFSCLQFTKHL